MQASCPTLFKNMIVTYFRKKIKLGQLIFDEKPFQNLMIFKLCCIEAKAFLQKTGNLKAFVPNLVGLGEKRQLKFNGLA